MTTRRLFKDEDALFKVDINNIKPGTLLLAEPFMPDPNFKRAVVLICEHNEDGTIGFILNRETELKLQDAIEGIENFESTLYFGGPVQTDSLHYFHPYGEALDGSIKVAEGIYWGGNFEGLKAMIANNEIKNDEIRFFAGYAGWSAGQLEEEIKNKSWLVSEVDMAHVLTNEPDSLWQRILKGKGRDYTILANFPEDPSFN